MPVKPVDKNSKNDTEKSEEKKEPEKKPSGGTKEPDKGPEKKPSGGTSSSPTPSPSPQPRSPIRTSFQWDELNRLTETMQFWQNVVVPAQRKHGIDDKLIAYDLEMLIRFMMQMVKDKILMEAPRGVAIERVVELLNEELPKLQEQAKKENWDAITAMSRMLALITKLLKRET